MFAATCRSDSPQAILDMLQSAVSAADSTTTDAKMAGRAHFRLAHYADALYRNLQDQKQTPEWHTAQAFIGTKRQQVQANTMHQTTAIAAVMTPLPSDAGLAIVPGVLRSVMYNVAVGNSGGGI